MKDDKPQAKGEPKNGSPKDTLASHPVGTAAGAVGGMAAGAVAGMAAGPVGSLVGAVAGAVGGAVMGGGAGHAANPTPTSDDDYWREHYASRPYVRPGSRYEDYAPAYRYGAAAHGQHRGRRWEDVEPELRTNWARARGDSSLEWDHARDASRDAWDRLNDTIERMMPGDSDGDGR